MRQSIATLFCLGLIGALALSAGAAEQVKWQTDLEAAARMAREQNRPVLLHFWSPDCGHCKQVEEAVFSRGSVAETLGDFFIPVKINAQEQPGLAARYRVQSVPKDVILSPSGQELHRLITPASPQQYIAQLSAVAFRTGMSPTRTDPPSWEGPASSPLARDRLDSSGPPRSQLPPMSDRSQVNVGPDRDRSWAEPARSPESAPSMESSPIQPQEVINRYARGSSGPAPQPTRRVDDYRDVAEAQAPQQEPQQPWGRWPHQTSAGPAEVPPESTSTRPPAVADQSRTAPPTTVRQPAPRTASEDRRPPLGLDGYCPVTLIKRDIWKQGDARYGIVHRGRLYLFAGEKERDVFSGDPDDYSPVLAGIDPVHVTMSGEAVEGQRTHGVVYRKRVYLFSSEENLQRFWQDPERFAAPIRQAMEAGTVNRLFR